MIRLSKLLREGEIKRLPTFNCGVERTDEGHTTLFADGTINSLSEADKILVPDETVLQWQRTFRNGQCRFIVGLWDIVPAIEVDKSDLHFRRPDKRD